MATRVQSRGGSNSQSYRNHRNTAFNQQQQRQGRRESQSGGSFFLGNIDKELTREQVYDILRTNKAVDIYISKFDMPRVEIGTTDDHGRPINCAGYAFVHTRTQAQANAMLKRKTIRIGKLNAEIKPYDQAKREASQTRHRERQASLSSQLANSRAESPDWTVTENGNWLAEQSLLQSKLVTLEDSFAIESAYVSDANDETMSLSQSVVNSEHGMPMEMSSTSRRNRPESKLSMGDSKQMGKMVMKSLLDDDITPTAERVDAKLKEFMELNRDNAVSSQMVPIQENFQPHVEHQTHVEDSHVYNPLLILENPATNNVLINQQSPPLTNYAAAQTTLPFQLNTAPATLQTLVTLQAHTPPTPSQPHFTQSPVYLTLMQEAERLRADNSNNQIYQNCYSLWYNYYMAQNAQAVTELFNTSAHKYHENLSQNVEKYVTQY